MRAAHRTHQTPWARPAPATHSAARARGPSDTPCCHRARSVQGRVLAILASVGSLPAAPGRFARSVALRCARRPGRDAVDGAEGCLRRGFQGSGCQGGSARTLREAIAFQVRVDNTEQLARPRPIEDAMLPPCSLRATSRARDPRLGRPPPCGSGSLRPLGCTALCAAAWPRRGRWGGGMPPAGSSGLGMAGGNQLARFSRRSALVATRELTRRITARRSFSGSARTS